MPSNLASPMSKLPSLILGLLVSILLLGCSKDSDCLFVGGKWCDSLLGMLCIEFRANGEYYLFGARAYKWKTDEDCELIEFFDPITGVKISEATIISITGNSKGSKMLLEQGDNKSEYTKQ